MTTNSYILRENIFLIGDVDSQIIGNKLPSKKQILKVLFFNMRRLNYSLRESALLVVKEVFIFWEKAGIPVQTLQKCTEKVEKMYNNWRSIQKRAGQKSNETKEMEFKRSIEMLFDIASSAEILQGIDERKINFLNNQRNPERIGFIGDTQPIYDEDLTFEEINFILEKRKQTKYEREQSTIGTRIHSLDKNMMLVIY